MAGKAKQEKTIDYEAAWKELEGHVRYSLNKLSKQSGRELEKKVVVEMKALMKYSKDNNTKKEGAADKESKSSLVASNPGEVQKKTVKRTSSTGKTSSSNVTRKRTTGSRRRGKSGIEKFLEKSMSFLGIEEV